MIEPKLYTPTEGFGILAVTSVAYQAKGLMW